MKIALRQEIFSRGIGRQSKLQSQTEISKISQHRTQKRSSFTIQRDNVLKTTRAAGIHYKKNFHRSFESVNMQIIVHSR